MEESGGRALWLAQQPECLGDQVQQLAGQGADGAVSLQHIFRALKKLRCFAITVL